MNASTEQPSTAPEQKSAEAPPVKKTPNADMQADDAGTPESGQEADGTPGESESKPG